MIDLMPTELPDESRVSFYVREDTGFGPVKILFNVLVDDTIVGTASEIPENLWRIDTSRNGHYVCGLGPTLKDAKISWWSNWKLLDPRATLKLVKE